MTLQANKAAGTVHVKVHRTAEFIVLAQQNPRSQTKEDKSMDRDGMLRVNRANPCPVCGKPDWCLVAADNSVAICQRIEDGSVKKCGEAGWLHRLSNDGWSASGDHGRQR